MAQMTFKEKCEAQLPPGGQDAIMKLIENPHQPIDRYAVSINRYWIKSILKEYDLMTEEIEERIEDLHESATETL